jgi:hypothetical protein
MPPLQTEQRHPLHSRICSPRVTCYFAPNICWVAAIGDNCPCWVVNEEQWDLFSPEFFSPRRGAPDEHRDHSYSEVRS